MESGRAHQNNGSADEIPRGSTDARRRQARLVIHSSVAALLRGNQGALSVGFAAVVVDNVLHQLASAPECVVIMPATNNGHLTLMSTIAEQYPFVGIVATVVDATGHLTHQAIEGGATWVLNISIPFECSVTTLRPLIDAHLRRPALLLDLGASTSAVRDIADARLHAGISHQDDEHLVELLRGTSTTTEIARACFCSERSMYRRIRALYDRRGVSGRRELQLSLNCRTP